jgi:Protein of unknown function (DUF2939)
MPLRQTIRILVIAALALAAASCAETTKIDAAGDIHVFLIAIRDGDRTAFNAHVDRDALKIQIRSRILEAAARRDNDGGDLVALAAMLGRPMVDKLADALIQPDVFRAVADYLGYSADKPIPGQFAIAQALKPVDADHVCVVTKKQGPCVLDFRNEDGVWKLIGFEGDMKTLKSPKMKLNLSL